MSKMILDKSLFKRMFTDHDRLHTILEKLMADEEVPDTEIHRALVSSRKTLDAAVIVQKEEEW